MQQSGLIDQGGGQMHALGQPSATATDSQQASVEQSVESHLDSFFNGSRWTRTDVLVMLAVVQTLLLGYVTWKEVTD
jgi:hypothetical protein